MLGNEHFWAQVTSFRTSEPHVSVCQWGIAVSSESESLILTALLSRQRSTLWKSTQLSQHRMLSPAETTLHHPFMSLSLISRVSTYLAGIVDALLAALSTQCFLPSPVFCHLRLTYDIPLPPYTIPALWTSINRRFRHRFTLTRSARISVVFSFYLSPDLLTSLY